MVRAPGLDRRTEGTMRVKLSSEHRRESDKENKDTQNKDVQYTILHDLSLQCKKAYSGI